MRAKKIPAAKSNKYYSETAISKRIADKLIGYGYIVIRINSGMIANKRHMKSYEIKNKQIECKKVSDRDVPLFKFLNKEWKNSGFSDLFVMRNGITTFVEVKTPTGVQSDKQKAFQEIVESAGNEYILADCVKDVERLR